MIWHRWIEIIDNYEIYYLFCLFYLNILKTEKILQFWRLSPCAGNWLPTTTSDQTNEYTIIRRFHFELIDMISLDRNYWELWNLLFVLFTLFYLNILKAEEMLQFWDKRCSTYTSFQLMKVHCPHMWPRAWRGFSLRQSRLQLWTYEVFYPRLLGLFLSRFGEYYLEITKPFLYSRKCVSRKGTLESTRRGFVAHSKISRSMVGKKPRSGEFRKFCLRLLSELSPLSSSRSPFPFYWRFDTARRKARSSRFSSRFSRPWSLVPGRSPYSTRLSVVSNPAILNSRGARKKKAWKPRGWNRAPVY